MTRDEVKDLACLGVSINSTSEEVRSSEAWKTVRQQTEGFH